MVDHWVGTWGIGYAQPGKGVQVQRKGGRNGATTPGTQTSRHPNASAAGYHQRLAMKWRTFCDRVFARNRLVGQARLGDAYPLGGCANKGERPIQSSSVARA